MKERREGNGGAAVREQREPAASMGSGRETADDGRAPDEGGD
eukprot:CAMPEP_0177613574 /NCGR_PEP_ID=MMETSP0419_2-20121207/22081_1 /TAXON_ID=582737 /ORGANISM="Tetraselmis sp., Strain GSL018" /LENGTH=41 /DNA_ID= /DNA_START= /DNA_END= /DNA_ORIENTATION=